MSEKRAAQRSYAEWDRLVDEWSASGEKQGKFAEAHGIKPKTFQGRVCQSRKRRGLTKKRSSPLCSYVEVTPATEPDANDDMSQGSCRITMNRTTVAFSAVTNADWIAEVLTSLGKVGR